jgi:mannose-6-phosphate isomerase-like protein (cupin superfamily)
MKDDLHSILEVLTGLGFRIETIMPADDPARAIVSGHGVRLQVGRGEPLVLGPEPPLRPSFVVTRNDPEAWGVGRAGMQYRDLIPDRQGGRFIASHIRIPKGGPVPDYVHFHAIRFQMIYCYKGWVRLVYEDQGAPFVMNAGDCVLQPPRIRHRVLECSPGLEVIEIGSPAIHATHADHEMILPTAAVHTDRDFDGQRFVAGDPLGIAAASGGVASARVRSDTETAGSEHDAELLFGFLLQGAMTVTCEGAAERLGPADAFVIPASRPFVIRDATPELAWLEVKLPA